MAAKMTVLLILAIIVVTVGFFAVTACVAWLRDLYDADRAALRDTTQKAKWATEDLEDAAARQKRRKK